MSRWYAMSTHFLTDEKIEQLGIEHGPAGPLAIVSLLSRAKTQSEGGKVVGTYRELAFHIYSETGQARDIIKAAKQLGLVDGEMNGIGYELRFPAWDRWQGAFRKAKQREVEKAVERKMSRDVHTGQDKTGQDNESTPDVQTVFDEWVKATDRDSTRTKLTSARRSLIARRLKEYPLEDLIDAVRGIGASQFHRGDNDRGKRYDTLELALRNAEKIEGFRDKHRNEAAPTKVNKFLED
jgi:hypothetical protein